MNLRSVLVVTSLLALTVAACGDDGSTTGTDGIRGITWTTSEIVTGGVPTAMPAGARLELTLGTDGQLGARAGCNSMSGTYRITDGHLVTTDLGQTEMGCAAELMANDAAIASLLGARPVLALADGTLTLTGPTTALRLVDLETVDPTSPLVGTTWTLDTIIDGQTASTIPQELQGRATLAFDTERLGWTGGCNHIGGDYQMDKGVLTITGWGSTAMLCPEPAASMDLRMTEILRGSPKVTLVRHRLTIVAPNGQGLGFVSG